MEWLIVILTGILGLLIGSFLNVVVLRMNTGKGLNGRSMCFSCGKTLSWHELIPVVSYFIQKGKCRSCRSCISIQYVIVELVTGIVFAGVAARIDLFAHPVTFFLWLLLVSLGMVIAAYDVLHKVIPEIPLLLFFGTSIALGMHGIGLVIVPLPFLVLWAVSRGRWIGFGDIELMACMGVLLGTLAGIVGVVISFWIACAVILPWYVIQKMRGKTMSHEIPFGPFLLLGAYLVGLGFFDGLVMMLSVIK